MILMLLKKNMGKGFILLKNSSKTGHLSRNYGSSNFLFCFTKILRRLLTIVMLKMPIMESYPTIKLRYVKSVRIRSYSDLHFPTFELNTERYEVSV